MTREQFLGVPLYELFHENTTKQSLTENSEFQKRPPDSWAEIKYKTYPTARRIELTESDLPSQSLGSVLATRRSPSTLTQSPIHKAELGTILETAAGITNEGPSSNHHRRAYPSAGRNYPLELYVAVLKGADIKPGLYHYNVREHSLELLQADPTPERWEFITLPDELPSFLVFLTGIERRTTRKYGNRGYRHILLEAGHLMQNLCLVAETQGLGGRPYAQFLENELDSYLDVADGEWSLYAGMFGEPRGD